MPPDSPYPVEELLLDLRTARDVWATSASMVRMFQGAIDRIERSRALETQLSALLTQNGDL